MPFCSEEAVDVDNISAQEGHALRVIMLNRLRDIDHHNLPVVEEQVIFGQVAVDEATLREHDSHHDNEI